MHKLITDFALHHSTILPAFRRHYQDVTRSLACHSACADSDHTDCVHRGQPEDEQSRRIFPWQKEGPALSYYYIVSSICHVIIIAFNGLAKFRGDQVLQRYGFNMACYLPRYLTLTGLLSDEAGSWVVIPLSMQLLVWRAYAFLLADKLDLSLFTFLVWEESDFQEACDRQKFLQDYQGGRTNFMQRVLFYHMANKYDGDIRFDLRPNRKPKARDELTKYAQLMAKRLIQTTIVGMALISLCTYWGLKRSRSSGHLCRAMSASEELAFNLVEILLTIMVVADSTLMFLSLGAINFLIVKDMKIYWRSIEVKLCSLESELKRVQVRLDVSRGLCRLGKFSRDLSTANAASRPSNSLAGGARTSPMATMKRLYVNLADERHECAPQLAQESDEIGAKERNKLAATSNELIIDDELTSIRIMEVQSLLSDYFERISEEGRFVQVSASALIAFFLLTHTILTLAGVARIHDVYVALCQLTYFICILLLGMYIMSARRPAERRYRVICSIMAVDDSVDKVQWSRLLRSYTDRPKFSFALINNNIFRELHLIQILAYTFSITMYMETKQRQMNETAALAAL